MGGANQKFQPEVDTWWSEGALLITDQQFTQQQQHQRASSLITPTDGWWVSGLLFSFVETCCCLSGTVTTATRGMKNTHRRCAGGWRESPSPEVSGLMDGWRPRCRTCYRRCQSRRLSARLLGSSCFHWSISIFFKVELYWAFTDQCVRSHLYLDCIHGFVGNN